MMRLTVVNQTEKLRYECEWSKIDWDTTERAVFKLQKRIYRASLSDNKKGVRHLQRLFFASKQAKLLAVRKVTQDNKGKNTPGVDGVASLTPVQRNKLANKLKLNEKATPIRRVWIDKPGKSEKRPLGIPTISTRAEQVLLKMTFEPEWEARFEPDSYGFRPGRSCHDAIRAIYGAAFRKQAYASYGNGVGYKLTQFLFSFIINKNYVCENLIQTRRYESFYFPGQSSPNIDIQIL